MRVALKGNTRKAKNRLSEAGTSIWEVVTVRDRVLHSSEPGPWLWVRPRGKDQFQRWVRASGDFHFKVIGFIPEGGEDLIEV